MSVVINFYNEVANVGMAPLALTKQNYNNFEVIFVDDGSTDGTMQQILKKYKHKLPRIRIIRNDFPVGLRKARNQGVKSAKGSIIITLDLHTTFDESFLKRIATSFATKNEIAAVGALVLPYGEKWFHDGFRTFNKALFLLRKRFKNYDYVFGTAAAYRTKVLEEIGYLSDGEIVEDVDASWKIKREGYTVLTLENNVVLHKGPQSSGKFFKTFLRDGLRLAMLLKEYKRKIIYPQSLARVLILPLLIILFVVFPMESLVLVCAVALSFLLVGYFMTRSLRRAVNFLAVTITYVLASSLFVYLGAFLSLLNKVGAAKKIGLDW